LQTSGVGWLVAAVVLVGLALAVFAPGLRGPAVAVTVADDAVVRRLGELHAPGLGVLWQGLAYGGSWWTLTTLEAGLLLALLTLRRWRHLLVWLVAWPLVNALAYVLVATTARRPRPFGVDLRTSWGSWAMPAAEVATFGGAGCDPVHAGAQGPLAQHRQVGRGRAGGAGQRRPDRAGRRRPHGRAGRGGHRGHDPATGFPLVCPRRGFPVVYRRGRSAHLDVGGARGVAIRRALEEQLGLAAGEIEPFGLASSAGSTPLRITVSDAPARQLFGKLYARSHLRADRWYKLGRELLYGQFVIRSSVGASMTAGSVMVDSMNQPLRDRAALAWNPRRRVRKVKMSNTELSRPKTIMKMRMDRSSGCLGSTLPGQQPHSAGTGDMHWLDAFFDRRGQHPCRTP
jgi:hypothetical protein